MTKRLEEIRDRMTETYGKIRTPHDDEHINKYRTSYKEGFNDGYAFAREEAEVLVRALEFYAQGISHDLDKKVEYFILDGIVHEKHTVGVCALNALDKWQKENE